MAIIDPFNNSRNLYNRPFGIIESVLSTQYRYKIHNGFSYSLVKFLIKTKFSALADSHLSSAWPWEELVEPRPQINILNSTGKLYIYKQNKLSFKSSTHFAGTKNNNLQKTIFVPVVLRSCKSGSTLSCRPSCQNAKLP